MPLSYDTVGRRWRVEGLLGRRSGGGVFSAFHLVSGARAALDLVPWPLSEDPAHGGLLYRELQALRLLERHPHIQSLLETGTNWDGSRFVATALGDERPLSAALEELRHPRTQVPPEEANRLLIPVLAILQVAHRLGIAHGRLDASWIYVAEGDGGRGPLVKLRGLQVHDGENAEPGAPRAAAKTPRTVPREVAQLDLRAVAALFCEIVTGDPQATPVFIADEALRRVLTQALSPAGHADAEALSRALAAAVPSAGPLTSERPRISLMMPALRVRPRVNTDPGALPAPLLPLRGADLPRAGLTHELRQVSLIDMIDQETAPAAPHETLATATQRPFSTAELLQVDPGPSVPAEPSVVSSHPAVPVASPAPEDLSWPLIEFAAATGIGAQGAQPGSLPKLAERLASRPPASAASAASGAGLFGSNSRASLPAPPSLTSTPSLPAAPSLADEITPVPGGLVEPSLRPGPAMSAVSGTRRAAHPSSPDAGQSSTVSGTRRAAHPSSPDAGPLSAVSNSRPGQHLAVAEPAAPPSAVSNARRAPPPSAISNARRAPPASAPGVVTAAARSAVSTSRAGLTPSNPASLVGQQAGGLRGTVTSLLFWTVCGLLLTLSIWLASRALLAPGQATPPPPATPATGAPSAS